MYEMNKIDRLKQTLIMHKDEIFQKWKSTITGSFFPLMKQLTPP